MITPAQSPSVSGHGHHHHHHHQGSSSSSSSSHSCSSALKQKRKRKRTSAEQLAVLEGVFRSNQHPNLTLRNQLAVQLLMTPRSVQKWFQNRRAKARNQLSPKSGSSSSSPPSGSPAAIDLTNASGLVNGLLGGVMNLNAAQGLLPATLGANPNVAMNTTGLVAALTALQQQQQQQFQQSQQQQQFQQQQHLPSLSNLMLLSNAAPLVNELQKEAIASSLENPNVISNGPMTLQDLCNISRFNSLVGNQLAAAAAVAAASQFSPSPSSSFDASFAALRKTASPQQPARPSSFSLPGSVISSQNVLAPIAVKPPASTLPSLPTGDTKPVNGLMLLSGIAGLMSDDAAGGKALPSPRSLQAGVPTDSEAVSPQASPATLGLSPSQSALFAACVNANEAQLLELIEQGADLNASDINGNTPLLVATRSGHTAIVKALVRGRVNVNAENKSGVNAVYLAAKFGHLATLDFLLQNGATPNKAEGQCLETALHAATNQGFIQIMQTLLDAGANVNAKDSAGRSPLHLHSGFTSVIKLLVSKGADVHATDNEGLTALHYAVRDGQVNAAQCLLGHGARLEDRTNSSLTPLHLVSKSDVAELLLEHKADFKAQTSEGKTILHLAVEKVDAELLSWLMEKGPGAELLAIKESSGLTPFELAEKKGLLNVVQYLKTVASGNNNNATTTTTNNSTSDTQQPAQQSDQQSQDNSTSK